MAFLAPRLAARFAASRGARRAVAYAARQAMRKSARFASRAGRYAKLWARRNPATSGFLAGGAAEHMFPRVTKRKLSSIRKGRIAKRPRKAGPVPKTPSSTVSARYAVAPRMTKFKKPTKKAGLKQPKSAIVHYKEYGQYNATQCMYVNHEHIGSVNKFWFGIALGLTKSLLAKAKVYSAKSIDDPMIGPRTSPGTFDQYDNKNSYARIRLVFAYNAGAGFAQSGKYEVGNQQSFTKDIGFEDIGANTDEYKPMSTVAKEVANVLMTAYHQPVDSSNLGNAWLSEAQILPAYDSANTINAQPIYIQNLDDAEIHLYVKSLIKFQNITIADHGYQETGEHGTTTALDSNHDLGMAYAKDAIDSNPLVGRIYSGKGLYPDIDTELGATNSTLDAFFQARDQSGITLCGTAGISSNVSTSDLARIQHIPTAKEIYGPKTITTGHIQIRPGDMKFHKTAFSFVKTFKELATYMDPRESQYPAFKNTVFRHTLFGLKCAHKHGADKISIGYNREQDIGCYVKITRKLFPLKAAYNKDMHTTTCAVVPSAFTNEAGGIYAP